MSSSSSYEFDERLDEVFDEIFEDTFNNMVEAQSIPQRTRAYVEETTKEDTTAYGMTTSAKIVHSRHIYSDAVFA